MCNLIIKLAEKRSGHISSAAVRNSCGTYAGVLGICFNLLLFLIKIAVGLLSGSISIVADALNNLSDSGSSLITLLGFKLSGKPADSDHPYGHGRMEYMSAFIVSAIIMLIGFELFKESLTALTGGTAIPVYSVWSILVLTISVVVKFFMYIYNIKLARRINSDALKAAAKDSVNDCIATSVILISVIICRIFPISFNLDAVLGIAVAVFILISGFTSAKETIDVILGGPPDSELVKQIGHMIMSEETFIGMHDLIVHNYGPTRQFASVHVEVNQNVNIVLCHELIDECEKKVKERLGVELVIHMDPIETDNEEIEAAKKIVGGVLEEIDPALTYHDFRMTPAADTRINLIFDVVVPNSVSLPQNELYKLICEKIKKIHPIFECVITFDNDYTGK